jgi:hypothetical protein
VPELFPEKKDFSHSSRIRKTPQQIETIFFQQFDGVIWAKISKPDKPHRSGRGRLPKRSNCKGPLGPPCAVTPLGTRPLDAHFLVLIYLYVGHPDRGYRVDPVCLLLVVGELQ